MTANDIAVETHNELERPEELSVAAIEYWYKRNIGTLNNYIYTEYEFADSGEIDPELGEDEKAILKKLYFIYFYDKKIIKNLGAASFDPAIEIFSDGSRIKTLNRNKKSKTFQNIKEQEELELADLIKGYLLNKISPQQMNIT